MREDAIRLYGFLTAGERDWFRLLQSVQGVGAKVALGILGALSAEALSTAVARQDKAMMARAPGVGPKLAARLVLELKDKAPAFARRRFRPAEAGLDRAPKLAKAAEDAVLALVGLGYAQPRPPPRWPGFRLSSGRRPRPPRSSARASRNWRNEVFYVIVIDR